MVSTTHTLIDITEKINALTNKHRSGKDVLYKESYNSVRNSKIWSYNWYRIYWQQIIGLNLFS